MPVDDEPLVVARLGDASVGQRYRVLVDRLWPRGVRKEGAPWDEWLPEVAPSTELRKWYGHDPARYDAFRQRYLNELAGRRTTPAFRHLQALMASRPVALVTASKQLETSQAPILAAYLATLRTGDGPPDP